MTGDSQEEYELLDSSIASTQPSQPSFRVSSLLPSSMIDSERERAEHLLSSYCDIFSSSSDDIGQTDMAHNHIGTSADTPIRQRAHRASPAMRMEIQSQVDDLLRRGIIEESYSTWANPIVMVKKKDNIYRLCIDYRALNAVTVRDSHPSPDRTTQSMHCHPLPTSL